MSFAMPDNLVKGKIIIRETGEKMVFAYNPATVTTDSAATWVKHKIPGKHHPRLQYAGGEGRVVTFDLHLLEDTYRGLDGYEPGKIDRILAWLEGLTYPDITGSSLANREPPRITLSLGRLAMNAVVEDTKVVQQLFHADLTTRYAVISMTLSEDMPNAVGYRDVRL